MTETADAEQLDATAANSAEEDAQARADEARMAVLIAKDTIVTAREKALKKFKEPIRAELLLLLKRRGYSHRRTAEGKASIGERRSFKVSDVDKLVDLFAPKIPEEHASFWEDTLRPALSILFDQIKVDKAFYEAATLAKIKIATAAHPDISESFKVEAHKTRKAKEMQQRIMDETRDDLEQRIEMLARRMIERNARSEP